jgi:hypothetical protein
VRVGGGDDRQLDHEHAVLVDRLGGVGIDLGAERDDAPERPVLDLELLVEALLVLGGSPVAGEDQLAAADLEVDVVGVDAREVGAHDRPRGVADVVDVDGGGEAAAAPRGEPAVEDAAEQLVHLPPHALEVGEEITFGHSPNASARLKEGGGA